MTRTQRTTGAIPPLDPVVASALHARLRRCDHPFAGAPHCPLCGAWPSRSALAAEILVRAAAQ